MCVGSCAATPPVCTLHRVRVLCPPEVSSRQDSITSPQQALQLIASHGSSELGFLQFFNLHRTQELINQLVRDRRLTATAAQLLGCSKLRLYQVRVGLEGLNALAPHRGQYL